MDLALPKAPEPREPGPPGLPESDGRPETSKDNYIKEDRVVSKASAKGREAQTLRRFLRVESLC